MEEVGQAGLNPTDRALSVAGQNMYLAKVVRVNAEKYHVDVMSLGEGDEFFACRIAGRVFWMPQIGDTVIVAFLDDTFANPIVMSKILFPQDDVVSQSNNLITSLRPNEGDLIYFPTVKKIWEISFVDHDDPFYQVNNLPVYKLYCRTFEYSSEVLDTGIYAIDDIETKRSTDALAYEFSLENQIAYNERIGQEWGTIYDQKPSPGPPWPPADIDIMLEDGTTNPNTTGDNLLAETDEAGLSILTEDSDAYYTFFIINEDYRLSTIDTQSENEWFEDRATGKIGEAVLDFTESNPFGDPTESM
ncbi:MAG: hypothetical protein IIB07_09855 [Bacteroidetes bacterium]|nr:hypothetical protein [Bacteroidota bacterium]